MKRNKAKAIETAIRTINGAAFCKVDYTCEKHDLLKTSKIDGSINPLWDDNKNIKKVVKNSTLNLGVRYEQAVENRATKNGFEGTFKAQSKRGKIEHTIPHKNLCMSLDGAKTYMRYMPTASKGIEVAYMLNGTDITEDMKKYRKVKTVAKTQAAIGLTKENEIPWRTLNLDNIHKITINGLTIG